MPCLSNLINSPPSALPDLKPILYDYHTSFQDPALAREPQSEQSNDKGELKQGAISKGLNLASFDEDGGGDIHTKIPNFQWLFLLGAPKLIQCGVCRSGVYPEEKILCTVRGCKGVFHLICAKESLGFSSSKQNQFKCPQHACFLCKQKNHLWRCIRCPIACHDKCAAFPEHVVRIPNQPGEVICWKHPNDWRLEKHEVPANITKDIFSLLPLPYTEQEFKIDINWKHQAETKLEPRSYVHIKRNVYLVKRKRNSIDTDIGCTNCNQCSDGCVCRVQCISCSKACRCPRNCTNRPFQKGKKIQIVKTELCGWGVVAAESISKGDFIVEYVGEVINDASCEKRLWDMKDQDAKNFYMCEINKDFVIDATFKGNESRFLNHSCAPNCKLEKWQVEGETRVGIFASRLIEVGEPLTYDYRFVQFGPEVECHCRAPNCGGYLGTKRKIVFSQATKTKLELHVSWGPKRQRSSKKIVVVTN
ncbi:histone-lysine N-methyltransferase ASHR3-like [Salvia splendens]|uniref:histone-lysine N-methyltransferase ASHR3-like n=1 Tax=Salvia splendens TaxID=180675 RepID=UPI001C27D8DF|nr:histone-lysine N-methyltransferase ASHR3-like [Salvia splendens]